MQQTDCVRIRQMERKDAQKENGQATGKQLLEIPNDQVLEIASAQMPSMVETAYRWIDIRPLLKTTHYSQTDYLEQSGVMQPRRIRDFIRISRDEGLEFIEATKPQDMQLELGDSLFALLLAYDELKYIDKLQSDIKDLIPPDILATFEGMSAEKCIMQALEMCENAAGDSEGKQLSQGLEALNDLPDDDFEKNLEITSRYVYLELVFNLAFRYAILKNWSLQEIIETVAKKNDKNMPAEFFGPFSPFASANENLQALRLFRKHIFTNENGFLQLYLPRYLRNAGWVYHPDGYDFRLWVHESLSQIAETPDSHVTFQDKIAAQNLINAVIQSERPLWIGSKYGFIPYSLESLLEPQDP